MQGVRAEAVRVPSCSVCCTDFRLPKRNKAKHNQDPRWPRRDEAFPKSHPKIGMISPVASDKAEGATLYSFRPLLRYNEARHIIAGHASK